MKGKTSRKICHALGMDANGSILISTISLLSSIFNYTEATIPDCFKEGYSNGTTKCGLCLVLHDVSITTAVHKIPTAQLPSQTLAKTFSNDEFSFIQKGMQSRQQGRCNAD